MEEFAYEPYHPSDALQSLSGGEFQKMFSHRAAQSRYNMVYK
jgi:hypothetical protein